jgi:hypothetical protein
MKLGYFIAAAFSLILFASVVLAQNSGGVKGKVRLENGDAAPGVKVTLRSGDADVASGITDKKGEFRILGIKPGSYSVVFNKPGYSSGILRRPVDVGGSVVELGDRLKLIRDDSLDAYIRGSVFDPDGRSVRGARLELWRIYSDGKSKKLKETASGEAGEFNFRLSPDSAKYRITVKVDRAEPDAREVTVDGAEIYRLVPFTLKPAVKN